MESGAILIKWAGKKHLGKREEKWQYRWFNKSEDGSGLGLDQENIAYYHFTKERKLGRLVRQWRDELEDYIWWHKQADLEITESGHCEMHSNDYCYELYLFLVLNNNDSL